LRITGINRAANFSGAAVY